MRGNNEITIMARTVGDLDKESRDAAGRAIALPFAAKAVISPLRRSTYRALMNNPGMTSRQMPLAALRKTRLTISVLGRRKGLL